VAGGSGRSECLSGVVFRIVGDDVPGDTRILVRQRDDGLIEASPLNHRADPVCQGRILASAPADRRSGAVQHHCAQIAIAALGHSAEMDLSARAELAGHQPEPGRDLAAAFELVTIADRSQIANKSDRHR